MMLICTAFLLLFDKCLAEAVKLNIGLVLPNNTEHQFSMQRVRPAVQIAIDDVTSNLGILGNKNISFEIEPGDSKHSDIYGPLAAIEMHKRVDLFLGPVYGYGVAPIARYSSYWGVGLPIISPGAPDVSLGKKEEFKLLTRIGPNYVETYEILREMSDKYDWKKFGLMYNLNEDKRGACYQEVWAAHDMLKSRFEDQTYPYKWTFHEHLGPINPREMLIQANDTVRCEYYVFF